MSYSKEIIVPKAGTARANYLAIYQQYVLEADEVFEAFAKKMVTNPVHTLRWAANTFSSAARLDVAKQMVELLQRVDDVEILRRDLLSVVINLAQCINNKSSSTCSNYMEECLLSEHATAYERFKYVETLD